MFFAFSVVQFVTCHQILFCWIRFYNFTLNCLFFKFKTSNHHTVNISTHTHLTIHTTSETTPQLHKHHVMQTHLNQVSIWTLNVVEQLKLSKTSRDANIFIFLWRWMKWPSTFFTTICSLSTTIYKFDISINNFEFSHFKFKHIRSVVSIFRQTNYSLCQLQNVSTEFKSVSAHLPNWNHAEHE